MIIIIREKSLCYIHVRIRTWERMWRRRIFGTDKCGRGGEIVIGVLG